MPNKRRPVEAKSRKRPKAPSKSSTPFALRIPVPLLKDARSYARAETVAGGEDKCLVFTKSDDNADLKQILLCGLTGEIERRRRTNIERRGTQGLSEDDQARIPTEREAEDKPPYQMLGQAPPKGGRPGRPAMPPEPYEADGGYWKWSTSASRAGEAEGGRWMRVVPMRRPRGRP